MPGVYEFPWENGCCICGGRASIRAARYLFCPAHTHIWKDIAHVWPKVMGGVLADQEGYRAVIGRIVVIERARYKRRAVLRAKINEVEITP